MGVLVWVGGPVLVTQTTTMYYKHPPKGGISWGYCTLYQQIIIGVEPGIIISLTALWCGLCELSSVVPDDNRTRWGSTVLE